MEIHSPLLSWFSQQFDSDFICNDKWDKSSQKQISSVRFHTLICRYVK